MTFRGNMEQAKRILKEIPPFRSQSTALASLVKFVRTKLAYNARIVTRVNFTNVIPYLFSYLLVPTGFDTVFSTAVTNLKKTPRNGRTKLPKNNAWKLLMDLTASSTKVYINHSQENQKHFNPTTPEPCTTDKECFSFFFFSRRPSKGRKLPGKNAESYWVKAPNFVKVHKLEWSLCCPVRVYIHNTMIQSDANYWKVQEKTRSQVAVNLEFEFNLVQPTFYRP